MIWENTVANLNQIDQGKSNWYNVPWKHHWVLLKDGILVISHTFIHRYITGLRWIYRFLQSFLVSLWKSISAVQPVPSLAAISTGDEQKEKEREESSDLNVPATDKALTESEREMETDPDWDGSGWWFIPDSETSELGSRYSGEPNAASIKSLLLCQLFKHIPGEMLPFSTKGSRMGFYKNLATLSDILS